MTSCVVTAVTDDGKEAPLLIEELNQLDKPDLLAGLELTASEILALWSIPELRDRLRKIAEGRVAARRTKTTSSSPSCSRLRPRLCLTALLGSSTPSER